MVNVALTRIKKKGRCSSCMIGPCTEKKTEKNALGQFAMACKIGVIKPSGFADTKLIS